MQSFSEIRDTLRETVAERCKGCSSTELRITLATSSILRGEISLTECQEEVRQQMAELTDECPYGAAQPPGLGGPVCRHLVTCEMPAQPAYSKTLFAEDL